ncbi:MAG: serine--tRNA ligase, partial [Candidatus Eisenbacteria sp.]|nr:serine--tRNA ligase [Candidatus Eisenbacteria bacterium]
MVDLRFIRAHEEEVREAIRKKHERADLDAILELDRQRRELLGQVETQKAQRNSQSQAIGKRKAAGEDTSEAVAAMREVSRQIKKTDAKISEIDGLIEQQLQWVPNLPHPDVPEGGEEANVILRSWGKTREEEGLRDHVALGESLGLLDFQSASRLSGSGFATFTGNGARLQRALINFMLDLNAGAGYQEIRVPYAVRAAALFGCGQLPKLRDDMYGISGDDLFLIPTAEVPLTNLFRGEQIREENLPINLMAYSPCFRREAGTYGKQTHGLIRLHQFDKVELVKLVEPETSYDELDRLTADAESVLQALELPYRVVLLAARDLSFAAAKTFDLELWAPGERRWLEVSSCSNFLDFQARRIDLRYRPAGGKLRYLHTLNGSGVALPRLIVAVLEHYQTPEGAVRIPRALRPYMGGVE